MSGNGLSNIRGALDNAEPFRPGAAPSPSFRTDEEDGGNGGPEVWDGDGLPPGCAIKPVGVTNSANVFLDALDQFVIATPTQMGRRWLSKYFAGDAKYLTRFWPRKGNDKAINGFSPEDCADTIDRECARRGIWNSMDRVRGRGSWRGPMGELVYHCGDVMISSREVYNPGVWDDLVYPAGARLMRPLPNQTALPRADDPQAAAWQIIKILKTWNFRRGALDVRLFFGMIIAGFLGGALDWRPSAWVTGDAGMGKSTLQKLRRQVMGNWSINASDATSAGIYQTLKFDALAVSLDEQEAGADNSKVTALVELAREAASSDLRLRGSAGHEAVSFQARSSFLFSSITSIPLKGQDLGRMAQLELQPFHTDAVEPVWTPPQAESWGRELLTVLLRRWPRFDETLQAYRAALRPLGHDSRGQDTFGTLLACADLALSANGFLSVDAAQPDPDAEELWEALQAEKLSEYSERSLNWQNCLDYLLASRPIDWKGTSDGSIGALCVEVMQKVKPKGGKAPDADARQVLKDANKKLALAGLKIEFVDGDYCLGIPNGHPQLTKIFSGSDWPGAAGNASGSWAKVLRGAPPDLVLSGADYRFSLDGKQHRGNLARLHRVIHWE